MSLGTREANIGVGRVGSVLIGLMALIAASSADGGTREAGEFPGSPRAFASAVLDPIRQRVLVYGGAKVVDGTRSERTDEMWSYDLGTSEWTLVSPANDGPGVRVLHACGFVTARDEMLLYGGDGPGSGANDCQGDIWSFSPGSRTWRRLAEGAQQPLGRERAALTVDPVSDAAWVTFGTCQGLADRTDYLRFDLSSESWSDFTPPFNQPPRRYWHTAEFDTRRQRILLHGGVQSGTSAPSAICFDPQLSETPSKDTLSRLRRVQWNQPAVRMAGVCSRPNSSESRSIGC